MQSKYADLLATLVKDRDLNKSIDIAYKYWKIYKRNVSLTENLVQLLIKNGDYTLAIECIKETIDLIKNTRLKVHVERFNFLITEIWLRHMGREDIARARLLQHLENLKRDYDTYKHLEPYFEEVGDHETRAQLTLNRVYLAIERDNRALCFEALNDYRKQKFAVKSRLDQAYADVLKSFTLEPKILLEIIDDENLAIDWKELEKNLEKGLESQSLESRRAYLLCLIKISRIHTKDLCREIDYSERILAFSKVPKEIFDSLEHYYRKIDDKESLLALLKKKLYVSPLEERLGVIRNIIAVTPVDDFEQNYFALRCLELESFEEIKSRLYYYDLMQADEEYFDLLETALEKPWPREEKAQILKSAINKIDGLSEVYSSVSLSSLLEKLEESSLDQLEFLRFKLKLVAGQKASGSWIGIYEKLLDLGVDEGWSIEKLVAEITDNRVLVDFTKKLVNANAARIDEVRRLVYSMRFDLDMHGSDVLESIKYVAETEILDRKTLDFILETKWGVDDWSSVIINQISHLDSSLIESYSLSLLELIERAGPPDHDICQRYRDEIYSKIDTDKKSTIIFSLFNLTDDYSNLQRVFLDEAFKLIKQDLLAEKSFTLIQSVLDSGYKKSEILSLISETLRDENIDYRDHSLKLLDILISEKR